MYLFKDRQQNRKFYNKFFNPNRHAEKVWVIATQSNTARSLESTGVRVLESAYIDAKNKGYHPFFGGFIDRRTGQKFIDISVPMSISKEDALRIADDKKQDVIIGISSKGVVDPQSLPKISIPEQGSEPVI